MDHLPAIEAALADPALVGSPWWAEQDHTDGLVAFGHIGHMFVGGAGPSCGGYAEADYIAACHPEAIRSLIERLRVAEADAARLTWLESQWRDGIHVETCATGGPTVHGLRQASTVYVGGDVVAANTIRAAIDAAMSTKETP